MAISRVAATAWMTFKEEKDRCDRISLLHANRRVDFDVRVSDLEFDCASCVQAGDKRAKMIWNTKLS